MSELASIAYLCEGDAETFRAFSGIAKQTVAHLRRHGHRVAAIDADLHGPRRYLAAARTFSRRRDVWKARYHYSEAGFQARSRQARRGLAPLLSQVDILFQIGATFAPPFADRKPYVLFCDWNMALSMRHIDQIYSSARHMKPAEAWACNERQRAIYEGAATIFTISERLRRSFIEDYGIASDRVVTAYTGSNIDPSSIPVRSDVRTPGHAPTVLFSGKEFERKGGDLLLAAFRILRGEFPDARLVIIGPRHVDIRETGVEVVGFLNMEDPGEFDRLVRLYTEADVFCLPSRFDPFPSVVREAMTFGLPCVTSDIFAMPEMVVDGETGFTFPTGNIEELADRLARILRDPDLALKMGRAGRERATRLFNYDTCVRIISDRIGELLSRSSVSAIGVDAK